MPRGFSLVEILMVLILLIVGIFAVIRLFPEGFVAINASAYSVVADSLIKRNEDNARKFGENLPLGVVGIDPATGGIRANLVPGDLLVPFPYTENTINGNTGPLPEDPRFSYINAARRVLGEGFKIPPPSPFPPDSTLTSTGGYVSLYHVLYSPIYSDMPSGRAALGVAVFSGTGLQRVTFQDPPSTDNLDDLAKLGAFGYGVDYDRGLLHFLSAPYDRIFKIEFSYRTGTDTGGQSLPNNCIYIPANITPNQQLTYNLYAGAPQPAGCVFYPLPAGAQLIPGSESLYRRFRQLLVGDPFTGDAYEFKVYDTTYGLLGFNPLASSLPLPSREGRGLTARVDYDVDDWTILRQDETVPLRVVDASANASVRRYPIKLMTRLKKVGDFDETPSYVGGGGGVTLSKTHLGLIRDYPAGSINPARPGTPGIDLILVDIETGYRIDSRTMQRGVAAGVDNTNGEIDYSAGVIHLRDDGSQFPQWSPPPGLAGTPVYMPPAGRHVRVYYRTDQDFGIASYKPYSNYLVQPDPAFLGPQQYTPLGGGYLLFPIADAEKTVAVDYSYLDPVSGIIRQETGELQKIGLPTAVGAPAPGRAWLRLRRDPLVDTATFRITGIRGVSFHSHVIWREASRVRNRRRATLLTSAR